MKSDKVEFGTLQKYIKGQYSFQDIRRIANWFSDNRYQSELQTIIQNHWTEFEKINEQPDKDLSVVFNRLKKQILEENSRISFTQRISKIYYRAAAVLLIPLLIYSGFTFTRQYFKPSAEVAWIEVESPAAARTHFELPDGTKVSLNGGTHLFYPSDFSKSREVRLTGEAYFDVVHDESSPFVVRTEELDVKVLGTKFSVAAFDNENQVDVILEEGKVQLTGVHNTFSAILKPDEGFFYDKGALSGTIKNVEANYYTAWKDGMLIFRSEPLGEVFKRIGHWYNVRFDLNDKSVEGFLYRATFQNESLDEVLRLIALTAPIEYEINERNMDKNGIYNEKTISVKRKK